MMLEAQGPVAPSDARIAPGKNGMTRNGLEGTDNVM